MIIKKGIQMAIFKLRTNNVNLAVAKFLPLVLLLIGSCQGLLAASYDYTPIDYAGAAGTMARGINSAGHIVGIYTNDGQSVHGFILSNGTYTQINYPDAISTFAVGINGKDEVVGYYIAADNSAHGFLLSNGVYSSIDCPGEASTWAYGINNSGQIVGETSSPGGHGFLLSNGTYSLIDPEGSTYTTAWSITEDGRIAGYYWPTSGAVMGYVKTGNVYSTFRYATGTDTKALGINDLGQVAGNYLNVNQIQHGFLLDGGIYTAVDYPSSQNTSPNGINNSGLIVGSFTDPTGNTRGFKAIPPLTQRTLALPAGGAASTSTLGQITGASTIGYTTVALTGGNSPYGTAVFSFKQNGITVTEAGVPASPPTASARIFVDYRSAVDAIPGRTSAGKININTGIAVVNPGSVTANVNYTLRNLMGSTIASGVGTIDAGAHFAKFINQMKDVAADFDLPSDFQAATQFASLEISSDQPLSIIALRMTTNQRDETLFTTTPIADLTKSLGSDPLYFPQFADGGGYTTALVLMNTSSQVETGTFQILDNNGAPIAVTPVGGTTSDSFSYSIPAGGAFHFQTNGLPAATKVGWLWLTPDAEKLTPVGAGLYGYNPENILVAESGVPAAVPTTHAHVYVDLSGAHNTGLAMANPSNAIATITIRAIQSDGASLVVTNTASLPIGGHDAKFADQLVDGLPAGFVGMLDLSSTTPFSALTLRSLTNERDDFLFATFPFADQNQTVSAPVIFPQIADGGGYITQFFMLGSSAASNLTFSFYKDNGTPMVFGQ